MKPILTLTGLTKRFSTEDACKAFLRDRRWPNGVTCPRCQNTKVFELKKRPFHWVCKGKDCGGRNGYRFSVITRTVFENTNYPLRTWFQVIYLMLQSKKGISALQIHRMIGSGSYKTAWYMCHRIRAAMKDGGFSKLMGVVEVDETFIGGKDRNRHRSKRTHLAGISGGKVGVIGAIARKGNVVCQVIENTDRVTLSQFVRRTVSDRVSLLATDQHTGYARLVREFPHQAVNHEQGEYVRGAVHTNNLEAFWSLLKRGVIGTYHNVSKAYLPLYLAEFSFRHNHRQNANIFDAVVAEC